MQNLVVFCGSKSGADPEFEVLTQRFGHLLAAHEFQLIYGGARSGLMGSLASAVLTKKGRVVGVMPSLLEAKESIHPGISDLVEVADMAARKQVMTEMGDAFIALPGGTGTLDELFEVFTLSQIGQHHKPCGILNFKGYFDSLLLFLEHARDNGFLHPDYFDMLLVDDDPQRLLNKLSSFQHPHHR
ncbi:MAG: TIGR00730 family Rossman fold protein [Neptuniibacter sp.]